MVPASIARFSDAVLRGFAQVVLQDNPVTGLLLLLGVCVGDWVCGLYALLGTVVSTATASLFGAPRDAVGRGLYGFNGMLIGVALASFLRHDPLLPGYVVLASAFAAVATPAVKNVLGAQGHALTAPSVFTTWFFVAAQLDRVHPGGAPASGRALPPAGATALGLIDAATGVLNGLAQVMLQQNV